LRCLDHEYASGPLHPEYSSYSFRAVWRSGFVRRGPPRRCDSADRSHRCTGARVARKANEILRHAGELAERENVETVTEEHVRDAQEWAQIDRFEELLRGSTTQAKFILYSLALLSEENPNTEDFSTSRIIDRYKETAEKIDATILSEHRVYELVKEQAFLGVVESTHTGGGRGQGSYLEHRLVQDTEIVLKSVLRDSRLEDLA
jgi:cell division control protein 6